MNRIEAFLNKFDRDLNMNPDEIKEMKEEMRSHLLDYVKEAQLRGLTEQQAITEALEHFGDESQIQKDFNVSFPKKLKKFWLVVSLVLLLGAVLVQILYFSALKFNESQRDGYLRSVENNLLYSQPLDEAQLEKELKEAINNHVFKDFVIEDRITQEYIFKTIGSEGFPQDDSFSIETVFENRTVSAGNKVYYFSYTYNTFKWFLMFLISIALLLGYWFLFPFWFFQNYKNAKWTGIIVVTNVIGYWVFKRMHLKKIQ